MYRYEICKLNEQNYVWWINNVPHLLSSVHEMDRLREETVPVTGRSGAQSSVASTRCTSKVPSVKLLKFADDTTVIGLIQDGDESAYRQEFKELAVWCSLNNLELNMLTAVEMIVDFRRNPPALPSLTIMNSTATAVVFLDLFAL